jgi:hypothetical protein
MSVESWKSVFDVGAVALVFLTFVFAAGALITGNIINERQAEQIRKFDSDLTVAKRDLTEAQRDNLDMRYVMELHRHLTGPKPEEISAALLRIGVEDLRVRAFSTPDSEPSSLLAEIWPHLSTLQWREAISESALETSVKSGVEVWTADPKTHGMLPHIQAIASRSWHAGEAITEWLRSNGIHFVEHREARLDNIPSSVFLFGLGADSILIVIGDRNIDGELKLLREKRPPSN